MSFFEQEYKVSNKVGDMVLLTAERLYEEVLEDSKSNYSWSYRATELVRICNEPYFSQMYAIGIKVLILNHFANLEQQKEDPYCEKSEDKEAVYFCYHSLSSADETVVKVKQKYLMGIIIGILKHAENRIRFPMKPGPSYHKICEEWKEEKFKEFATKEEIDFDQLRKDLQADFEKKIKTAEENGTFKEDDKQYSEQIKEFLAEIDLKD